MVNVQKLISSGNILVTDTSVFIDAVSDSITGTLPALSGVTAGTAIFVVLRSNGSNIAKLKTSPGDVISFEQTSTLNTTLYPMDANIARTGMILALDSTTWVFFPSNVTYWIFDDSGSL
jgi:hypothetical protein